MGDDTRALLKEFFIRPDGSYKRGRCIESWLQKKHPEIYDKLLIETSFLAQDSSFKERLFCIKADILEQPVCSCGNKIEYSKFKDRYKFYCGKDKTSKCYVEGRTGRYVETVQSKYGVRNVSQIKEVKEKKRQSYYEKYGVVNPQQRHLRQKVVELRQNYTRYKRFLKYLHRKRKWSLSKISRLLGVANCLISQDMARLNLKVVKTYNSLEEDQIYNFIRELVGPEERIIRNDRDLLPNKEEIDIFIPSKNIAIEFNGLFWHSYDRSETIQEKERHQSKALRCQEQGVKLFTIFENEWLQTDKQDIWKSILRMHLSGPTTKYYARNCQVKELEYKPFKEFCEENHIQGSCSSSVYLGAFYKEQLVSVMSFKIYQKGSVELTRFCNRKDTQVIGIASKLLKYFTKNYSPLLEVYSYADLRYSYGQLYEKLNFKQEKISKPSYYYSKNKNLYHRRGFQRQYLPRMLGDQFDPSLSESKNIFKNTTYRRIWDCGKIKFVLPIAN
jgi:hypothetical protein